LSSTDTMAFPLGINLSGGSAGLHRSNAVFECENALERMNLELGRGVRESAEVGDAQLASLRSVGQVRDVDVLSVMRDLAAMPEGAQLAMRAYFEWRTEACKKESMQLAAVTSESVGESSSVVSLVSRASRRSERRRVYLSECEAAARVDGYCYLEFVRVPSRLSVRERIGPRPGLERFLSITAEEFDLERALTLSLVAKGSGLYHVERSAEGDALMCLRRTLYHFPQYGLSMRQVVGCDSSDGPILSLRSVVGSEGDSGDEARLRSALDDGYAMVYCNPVDGPYVQSQDVVDGEAECLFQALGADGYLAYRLGPLMYPAVALVPKGVYAELTSVRVGSEDAGVCLVMPEGSAVTVKVSLDSTVPVAEVGFPQHYAWIGIRVIPMRDKIVGLLKASGLWFNYLSDAAKFAWIHSHFYIHMIPWQNGEYSAGDVDVVQVSDPLDNSCAFEEVRCTVRTTGTRYAACFDQAVEATGIVVFRQLRSSCRRSRCCVADIAVILDSSGSVSMNSENVYLQMVVDSEVAKTGLLSFHVVGDSCFWRSFRVVDEISIAC